MLNPEAAGSRCPIGEGRGVGSRCFLSVDLIKGDRTLSRGLPKFIGKINPPGEWQLPMRDEIVEMQRRMCVIGQTVETQNRRALAVVTECTCCWLRRTPSTGQHYKHKQESHRWFLLIFSLSGRSRCLRGSPNPPKIRVQLLALIRRSHWAHPWF